MKKITSILTLASGMLAFGLSGNLAHATPISGSINFDGEATTNTGNLSAATSFSSIIGAIVVPAETGDYAAIPVVTPVTFTPFSFTAAGVTPLWTLTVGGVTYSFDATSITVNSQNANFLNLSGTGVANITGYTSTAGDWSITDTTVGGSPTFVFGADSSVPDGGTTAGLILLGLAVVGVGMLPKLRKLSPA
jgi:hypothetical protein